VCLPFACGLVSDKEIVRLVIMTGVASRGNESFRFGYLRYGLTLEYPTHQQSP